MNNKTSIIVTSHNYAEYLEKCIDSLVNQTVKPLEIIIINDSSSDNTSEIVKKYEGVEIIRYHEVSFGCAQRSRNFGLEKAKGEYILNMDADNYLHKKFIEKTQKVLDFDSDIHLVYTDHIVFGDDNLIAQTAQGSHWISKNFNYDSLRHMNYIDTTSLVRREGFEGFDENVKRFQDWDAWLSFLKGKQAKRVSKPLLFKRLHKKSKTSTVQLYMERLRVMAKHKIIGVCRDTENIPQKNQKKSGNTAIIVVAQDYNIDFLNSIIRNKQHKKLFVYIADVGDKECVKKMRDILREKRIVYRVIRRYDIDKALKGLRMNSYMPAYGIDDVLIVSKIPKEGVKFSDSCDAVYSSDYELTQCKSFDDISYIVFNRKGIDKFLNV